MGSFLDFVQLYGPQNMNRWREPRKELEETQCPLMVLGWVPRGKVNGGALFILGKGISYDLLSDSSLQGHRWKLDMQKTPLARKSHMYFSGAL